MPAPIVAYWEALPAWIPFGLAALAALLLAVAIWWLWWRLPKREAARLALKIRDAKARADVEDNYRKTVGQALGGIVVLLGAGTAYLQFSQQQQASHDLLISNQVSKGFEQLGNNAVVVRLGGIYALEGVMNGSDQYYRPVLEALTAFVRDGTRANTTPTLPTDIQAALTVIGRRSAGEGFVDLTNANIAGANLSGANLSGTNLAGTNLTSAHLSLANLTGTYLSGANLTNATLSAANLTIADLTRANLTNAYLIRANLTNAYLAGANLTGAHLSDANLTRAILSSADLTGADLSGADLSGANLHFAHLTDADLSSANLSGANLDGQKQLDEACGSDAVLPTGLTLKPCPP
jgi:Pentapeptide repeats (8 copies)